MKRRNLTPVQRPFFPPWAGRIEVVQESGDRLAVYGEDRVKSVGPPEGPPDWRTRDPMVRYLDSLRKQQEAPHIRFANAITDRRLVEFVEEYGPVWGFSPTRRLSSSRVESQVAVRESLNGLARERALFAAAVSVAGGLTGEDDEVADALVSFSGALYMPGPIRFGEDEDLGPDGHWYGHDVLLHLENYSRSLKSSPRRDGETLLDFFGRQTGEVVAACGEEAVTVLLNVSHFLPTLVFDRGQLLEYPRHSLRGVLPCLYFMLRADLLRSKGIFVCELDGCGNFFRIDRHGQRFCSARCAGLKRSRAHYRKHKEDRRS